MGSIQSYIDSGVNPFKAEVLLKETFGKNSHLRAKGIVSCPSGYASLFQLNENQILASSCDGVGTKLLLAKECGDYQGLGQDLLAMSVNDLICVGAKPLYFMDYLAMGELDSRVAKEILNSIIQACDEAEIPLVGGETAEMPGLYANGDFDLAGMATGIVDKNKLIDGSKIQPGDLIFGLRSSGFHSNGFSLIRKLIKDLPLDEKRKFLTPTKLYHHEIHSYLSRFPSSIKAIAHITGAGFQNIVRINRSFNYNLWYSESHHPFVGFWIKKWNLPLIEAFQIFNMGIGMVIVISPHDPLIRHLDPNQSFLLGEITPGNGQVLINNGRDPLIHFSGNKGA